MLRYINSNIYIYILFPDWCSGHRNPDLRARILRDHPVRPRVRLPQCPGLYLSI